MPISRAEIIDRLTADGCRRDAASLYADAYLEYSEATVNIQEHGVIVQHPRTANPIENPYLAIRERAMKRLMLLSEIKADFLWG